MERLIKLLRFGWRGNSLRRVPFRFPSFGREVRACVKASAQKLGLDPTGFAERSLNVGGKAELSGAGKVMMHA